MARDTFNTELGYGIYAENGGELVLLLSGTAAPDGTSGKQGDASIGSVYFRSGTGEFYQKIANAGNAADWELNGNSTASLGAWRPERVDAHTGQVLAAGVTDPTGWSDNDGGADGNDFTIGNYVLDGNCDLWEITAIGGATSITLAAAATPPAADDMFAVKFNLPDPAGQENQAIIVYDGSTCIKVADVDFANASGITIDSGYAPGSGDPMAGDSVLSAIQKIDGNVDALTSAVGVSQGDTDMGTYTGALLNDNESAKQNIQQLETEAEALRSSLGGSAGDTDMGAYTGNIISDNVDQRQVNQELEDAIESNQPKQFSGTVPQSTPTVVDSVLVDEIQMASWIVTARDTANPADVRSFHIDGLHDGHGAADATNTDDTLFARLNRGNVNVQASIILSGAGAAQEMQLELNTNEAGGITYTVERVHELPLGG